MELLHLSLLNNYTDPTVLQPPVLSYERQSSLEQQWSDLLCVLSTPSGVPSSISDVSPGNMQFNNGAAVVQNASMCSAAEPSVDDTFALQPNFSVPFPHLSSDYSAQSFDNTSMLFFPADCISTVVQQNNNLSNISNTTFDSDQPNQGLFGNLSILPLTSLECGKPELFGGTDLNYDMSASNASFSQSFDGLSPNIIYNQMSDQPTSAVVASMASIDENDVQDLLQMLQSDLADDLNLIDLIDEDEIVSTNTNHLTNAEDWSAEVWSDDSAVSSMESPIQQSYASSNDSEEVIGAAGGLLKYESYYSKSDASSSEYCESSSSFPFSHERKFSGSSNFTDLPSSIASNTKNVYHNHTYPLPSGRKSREELEEEARREKEERATRSRDEKRAKALKVSMTMDEIIESSVEQFAELVTHHHLNDAQQQLVRDIRRRGKNKMAAQNCRKRKMEVIQTIEEQVMDLRERRDALRRERGELDRNTASLKDKFKRLESELFRRLHDASGREYDPNLFSPLQTDDGGLYIVPRSNTTNASTSDETHDQKNGRKRKSKRKD